MAKIYKLIIKRTLIIPRIKIINVYIFSIPLDRKLDKFTDGTLLIVFINNKLGCNLMLNDNILIVVATIFWLNIKVMNMMTI